MNLKTLLINFSLTLFSLCIVILLSEMICRLMITKSIYFEATQPYDVWTYNDQLGWINRPNTECYYKHDLQGVNSKVTFDQYGIRKNDNPTMNVVEKKILVLGDSTTAGIEVDNNETYVALLEKLFQDDGYHFRFYNAGVRGYGTDQCFLNLKRLYGLIQPDYVIYMFCITDFFDNRSIKPANKLYGKPAFIMVGDKLRLVNQPSRKYPRSYYAHIEYTDDNYYIREGHKISSLTYIQKLKDFLSRKSAFYCLLRIGYFQSRTMIRNEIELEKDLSLRLERDLDLISLILKEIKKIEKNLIFTSFTTGEDIYADKFDLIAKKLDIPYLDISSYFSKEVSYNYPFDLHWNEKGHLQAAKGLHTMLKPILLPY